METELRSVAQGIVPEQQPAAGREELCSEIFGVS